MAIGGVKFGGSTTATAQAAIFTKLSPAGTSFKAAAAASWPKGQAIAVDFLYEPQAIGAMTETISFSAPAGDVFHFPILATCTPPQRQGPVLLRPDASTTIAFKNVFPYFLTIFVSTEPGGNFIVNKKTDVIAPKKVANLIVQCKMEEGVETCFGKMVIACTPPGVAEPIEWVYYLEGRRAEGVNASRRSIVGRKK
ncbi:unnamed protein product [Phytomonas sp. Hart1]|nr:unnamed protein product [Phytomonas sp. Hart1]|eukprot:CCW68070.1 unnamed protein product [Phytomonas sp. isolate Hart1]